MKCLATNPDTPVITIFFTYISNKKSYTQSSLLLAQKKYVN